MSNPSYSLRQANPADWPAVEALLRANKLPLDGAREHFGTYLVASAGGEVIGCVGSEVRGRLALLRSVAVAPGLQRQGIGRAMVAQMLQLAQRRDIEALYLLTTSAQAYFARLGFETVAPDQVPGVLKASAEFQGACPASAVAMKLPLARADRKSVV